MRKFSKAATLRKRATNSIPPEVIDWEVYPKNTWQYALLLPIDANYSEVQENIEEFQNFNSQFPPVKLIVDAIEIENWDLQFEAASPPPLKPKAKNDSIKEIELIPYGCTNIRITEFPTIKKESL